MKKPITIFSILFICNALYAIDPAGSHAYTGEEDSFGGFIAVILYALFFLVFGGAILVADFKSKREKDSDYHPVRDAAAEGIGCLIGGSIGIVLFLLKLVFKIVLIMFILAIMVVIFVFIGHLIFPNKPINFNDGPAFLFFIMGLIAGMIANKYLFKYFDEIGF